MRRRDICLLLSTALATAACTTDNQGSVQKERDSRPPFGAGRGSGSSSGSSGTTGISDEGGGATAGKNFGGAAGEIDAGGSSGAKPPGYVNVMDYGALGDGATDDTAAFQTATDTGKGVWVPRPSNYYQLSGPVILKGSIRGDMSDLNDLPKIRMSGADGNGYHVAFVIDGWSGTTELQVVGLSIDLGYTSGQWGEHDHCIAIRNSNNVLISNSRLLNAPGDGVMIGEWKRAPTGAPDQVCSNVTVTNNYIYNAMRCAVTPVFISGGSLISNNYMRKLNRSDYGTYIPVIDIEPYGNNQDYVANLVIEGNVIDAHTSDGADVSFVWQVKSNSNAPEPVYGTRLRNNRGYWGTPMYTGSVAEDANNTKMDPAPDWTMQPYTGT